MSPGPDDRKTTDELRRDIEATRAEMSETVDQIQQRVGERVDNVKTHLSPSFYISRARESLMDWRDSGVRALRDATDTATRKVDAMTYNAGERAGDIGNNLVSLIREHPVPVALIGAGIGLLAAGGARAASEGRRVPYRVRASRVRGEGYWEAIGTADNPPALPRGEDDHEDRGDRRLMRARIRGGAEQVRDRASGVGERISHLGGEVRHGAQDATQGMGDFIRDNPLAAGAAAAMLGALVGLLIPETRYEDRWMGEARDSMLDRARDAATEAREVAEKSVRQAADTAREEAEKHGLTGESVKNSAKEVAKDAAKTAKDTMKGDSMKGDSGKSSGASGSEQKNRP